MRSSPHRGSFGAQASDDRAIERMPIRLIVRVERALGSCEFCTGLIQLTARRLNFSVRCSGFMGKVKKARAI